MPPKKSECESVLLVLSKDRTWPCAWGTCLQKVCKLERGDEDGNSAKFIHAGQRILALVRTKYRLRVVVLTDVADLSVSFCFFQTLAHLER